MGEKHLLRCLKDRSQHRIQIFLHLAGAKAHYSQIQRFEKQLPDLICFLLSLVNFAIDFNHQAQGRSIKISDKWPDGLLPPEFDPIQLFSAQCIPEQRFTRSRIFAIFSRSLNKFTFKGCRYIEVVTVQTHIRSFEPVCQ
jgi:hypothetical protein